MEPTDRDRRRELLVLRAQAGDHGAYDELLAGIQRGLHRYLAGLLGDAHQADDALQETFLIVWRKLVWLREPAWFRTWIHRIATREAFRRLRRARTQELPLEPGLLPLDEVSDPRASTPDVALELAEPVLARLSELVRTLPAACRAVVLLHYDEGLPLEDVALVLEVPLGTVKSRLHYGLEALRRRIGPALSRDRAGERCA